MRKVLGCEDDDKFKSERVRAKGGNEVVKWSFFLTQEKRNELIAGIVLFKDSKNEVKCNAVDPLLNNKWFNKSHRSSTNAPRSLPWERPKPKLLLKVRS